LWVRVATEAAGVGRSIIIIIMLPIKPWGAAWCVAVSADCFCLHVCWDVLPMKLHRFSSVVVVSLVCMHVSCVGFVCMRHIACVWVQSLVSCSWYVWSLQFTDCRQLIMTA
jgi:hypothetical protein